MTVLRKCVCARCKNPCGLLRWARTITEININMFSKDCEVEKKDEGEMAG